MSKLRPMSLAARLTLAFSMALMAFLGISAVVLDRLFSDNARQAANDRLQGVLYTLLAATELTSTGTLSIPEASPDPRLGLPGSGLYARVVGPQLRWTSISAHGQDLDWPLPAASGESLFMSPSGAGDEIFVLSLGVDWELESGRALPFAFQAAESTAEYKTQIARFRRALWVWLGAAALLLLAVQSLVLRWSLSPLRQVAGELALVRQGKASQLRGQYPDELSALTNSINAFISTEHRHLARFRNSLADLAHSLKTPLAVLRTALDRQSDGAETDRLLAQLHRMDDIVGYQLKRARTQGHTAFAQPVPIAPVAESVVQTLEQAFHAKQVQCEFEIDPGIRFLGERGDLTELLGNLLENAFKWCQRRVVLSTGKADGQGATNWYLTVEDDGPGIDPQQAHDVLHRGFRGDEQIPGHGIGLAVVRDIADAYEAALDIDSSALGGARVTVTFGSRP